MDEHRTQKFKEVIAEKIGVLTCPLCKSVAFQLAPGTFTPVKMAPGPVTPIEMDGTTLDLGAEFQLLPMAVAVCSHCGGVQSFSLAALGIQGQSGPGA